jgi:hypothetical protein
MAQISFGSDEKTSEPRLFVKEHGPCKNAFFFIESYTLARMKFFGNVSIARQRRVAKESLPISHFRTLARGMNVPMSRNALSLTPDQIHLYLYLLPNTGT